MDTCVSSLHPLISNAGSPDRIFGAFCWRSCDVRIRFSTVIIVTKRPPVMFYGLAHPIYDQRHISIPFFSRLLFATNATCLRMLTTKEIPPSTFAAMVLIEATMVTREVFNSELEDRMSAMDFAVAATSSRRDVWPSRDEAFRCFKKRIPWMVWDERVILLLTVSPVRSQLFFFFTFLISR
jgi:hypothetical protein